MDVVGYKISEKLASKHRLGGHGYTPETVSE